MVGKTDGACVGKVEGVVVMVGEPDGACVGGVAVWYTACEEINTQLSEIRSVGHGVGTAVVELFTPRKANPTALDKNLDVTNRSDVRSVANAEFRISIVKVSITPTPPTT
jgi:hypothetical protein